jgi:hypothetical protein
MKFLKTLIIPLLVAFTACNQMEFEPMDTDANESHFTITHTISEFIAAYASEAGDVFPVRTNSGTAKIFSVDTIPMLGDSIVISGIVVSSDEDGNVYKNLVIQDPLTGAALKVSIDVSGLSAIYPVGQSISIRCNGLVIGKYADLYQLGIIYYNDDTDTRKKGYEPGRIPYPIFKANVRMTGAPQSSLIKVDTMTIAQIKASTRTIHSRIVCIKNAKFNGYGEVEFNYKKLLSSELYFGLPKPAIVGVPISREIEDPTGKMYVSTSEYAKFAGKKLPVSTMSGNIKVIVGWYRDKEANEGTWQLTLVTPKDLGKGFEAYHAQ